MVELNEKVESITQKYLRRWPDSKLARSWAGRMVHIQTDNGVWRKGGIGYTYAGEPDAWVLPFEEAQRQVAHCGPENRATFIAVRPALQSKDEQIERLTREKDEARENGKATRGLLEYAEDSIARLERKWQFQMDRAEAAEARVADLESLISAQHGDVVARTAKLLYTKDDKISRLVEALHFYAEPTNYRGEFVPGGHTDHGTFLLAHHVNRVRKDGGAIARSALETQEGGK